MPMYEDIALQLTLKALEHDYVKKAVDQSGKTGQEVFSVRNTNTAKEIAEFFNTILAIIENRDEDTAAQ